MDKPYLSLGTYRLKEADIKEVLLYAIQNGYTGIDTATLYRNQKFIGNVLKECNRDKLWITSKLPPFDMESEETIINSLVKTMKDLGTPYINEYLLHWPVAKEINKKAWMVLEQFHKQGYIHNIGVSNYTVMDLEDLMQYNTIPIFTNQIEVTPYLKRDDLVSYCYKHNISITAHSSLVKGERFQDIKLQELAFENKLTMAQLLLMWGMNKNFYVLPRTSKKEHIIENIMCCKYSIKPELIYIMDQWNENYATHPKYIEQKECIVVK